MNFLAHIYLSYDNEQIEVGNFIADSVRNSQLSSFSEEVQLGIKLHWEIDRFTDSHAVVKNSKKLLYPKYGKYSAVLVDIFYDHYLAKKWPEYHPIALNEFAHRFYTLLEKEKKGLPERIQYMLPYMKRGNWLFNYQYYEGMKRVLGGMSRRASFNSKMEHGVEDLKQFDNEFEDHFLAFFPELEAMAKEFISSNS